MAHDRPAYAPPTTSVSIVVDRGRFNHTGAGMLEHIIHRRERDVSSWPKADMHVGFCAGFRGSAGVANGRRPDLTPPAISRDALIGNPDALRQPAGLEEHVDRDAAARIPVAADAQPFRLDLV